MTRALAAAITATLPPHRCGAHGESEAGGQMETIVAAMFADLTAGVSAAMLEERERLVVSSVQARTAARHLEANAALAEQMVAAIDAALAKVKQ